MKKVNWKLIIIFSVIIIISAILLFYKLGDQYMWTDEIFSFNTGKMILEKGKPLYDSGLYYQRSTVYHYILALSMKLFGINEFGSRVINIFPLVSAGLILFFFIRDILKKNKYRDIYGIIGYTLFITLNFSVAMARETRMYAITTFLLILTIYAFYKGFFFSKSKILNRFKNLNVKYNITWIIIFGLSLYLAYETQPISILITIGLVAFFFIKFLSKRRWEFFILTIIFIAVGLFTVWQRYNTLNLYQVFLSLSPDWATNPPSILYYPVLLARNLFGMFLISPLILYTTFKFKKESDYYIFFIFICYLLFISLQKAQHERYLEPILPTVIIMTVVSIARIILYIKKKTLFITIISVILLTPQIYLLQKEIREIDTYTPESISIHKKMEFNKVFDYLDRINLEEYTLMGDYHASFTLLEKGYDIKYILVTENRINREQLEREEYFHTPYLVYESNEFNKLINEKKVLVIIRDLYKFPTIQNHFNKVINIEEPAIFY
ncbi:MAG: hypothetical protein PHE21_01185 [Candidatus Dojkabacteria bacterium]|nr:hypothetical protein [Candidatus Dojkabacteria bacterium]